VFLQAGRDVLAEVLGRTVAAGTAEDRQARRQEPGFGELREGRHEQPFGQITGSAEDDHSLDHGFVHPSEERGDDARISLHLGHGAVHQLRCGTVRPNHVGPCRGRRPAEYARPAE
jgi:hypothetical protein